jgi:hypothetical protein
MFLTSSTPEQKQRLAHVHKRDAEVGETERPRGSLSDHFSTLAHMGVHKRLNLTLLLVMSKELSVAQITSG